MQSPLAAPGEPFRLGLFFKLLAFAAVVAIATFIAPLGAAILRVATRLPDQVWMSILLCVVYLLISRLFLHSFERQPLRAIGVGFDRPWFRQAFLGLFIGAALVALAWLGLIAAGATWKFNPDFRAQLLRFVLSGVFACGVGAYEEVLCRGYAMQVLYRWKPAAGIILPGLYFVAVHLPQEGGTAPLAIVNMFLAHLVYVVCFLRTRSLWLGIGIHIAWNFFLAFVFGMPISGLKTTAMVMRTEMPHSLLTGNVFGPEAGLIVTAVLALAAILLWKLLPQKHPFPSLIDTPPIGAEATVGPNAIGPQLRRFPALDILRAIAVFGILPMNIQGFALHDAAVLNPNACAWTDNINVGVWVVTTALFGRKDLMLFAMMFGAGILMITDRAAAAGRGALQLHVQRMAALVLIALVHAYLIWSGDILFTYAVCGMIVFACRNWSAKQLLLAGSVLFLVPMVLLVGAQMALPMFGPETQAKVLGSFHPTPEKIQEHYEVFRGGWGVQMSVRAGNALAQHTVLLLLAMGWVAAGMMLVGMGLYRLGYLSGERDRASYVRLLLWTAPVGILLTALGFWINFAQGWRPEFSMLIGRLPGELGAPLLALATVALVMLLFGRREHGWLARSLAAVGQMSLTNYLAHSIILTIIFYGTGFGMIGRLDRVQQLGIIVAIWIVQMLYSPLWLKYFRFGPAEWLWRSLTYVKLQPMRRSAAILLTIFVAATTTSARAQSLAESSSTHIKAHAVEISAADPAAALLPILKDRRVITIGEIHGTVEMPHFALEVSRLLLNADRDVALGLEIPINHQEYIDEARASGSAVKLRETPFFQRPFQDGRSSRAMADLIVESGRLPNLAVFAFDRSDLSLSLKERDQQMAENVLEFMARHPRHIVILFAGNLHTKSTIGTPFDAEFRPAGYFLTHLPHSPLRISDVASLLIQAGRGSYWICPSPDPAGCGSRDFVNEGSPYVTANDWSRYMVPEEDSATGYTHTVFLRSVSASPPLKQE